MSITQAEKAHAFRALHERDTPFVIPNPWDVGSARILAAKGFEALATTSAGFAFSIGRADAHVSRDDVMAHIRTLAGATHLPISADLERGYGDAPETVAETIRLAAEAGAVGGSIEDASRDPDAPIYDFNQALERVIAGVEAARALDFPFTFTARAENFLYGRPDLDDTIARLKAFEEAGADVLYAPALRDLGIIEAICSALTKPVNVLMGLAGAPFTVSQLGEIGVRRISVGSGMARAAYGAFLRAIEEVRDKETFTFAESAASMAELTAFMESGD
jgi:2-methylisocitrate lyase-like PEP mutase family enzyme